MASLLDGLGLSNLSGLGGVQQQRDYVRDYGLAQQQAMQAQRSVHGYEMEARMMAMRLQVEADALKPPKKVWKGPPKTIREELQEETNEWLKDAI